MEDAHDLVHGAEEWVRDAGSSGDSGESDVDALNCGVRGCSGGFEGLFDLLFELIEADSEGLAGFGGSGLEPGVADELETALFATEPVKAEVLAGLGSGEGCSRGSHLLGEDREGGVEG